MKRVKILFSVPTTYEIEFNPRDFEWEMEKEGKNFEELRDVEEWFQEHAPDWLLADGELCDSDYADMEVIDAVAVS
jgi:hypothetical protein